MLGVTEDAEDVAQSVFVKAWQAWGGFEGNEIQRKAWLLRITRNATVDAARKRNLRRMSPIDLVLEERTAQLLSSPDFEGDEILARLHAVISTLPPKQRWVFQARYFDDRPYADLSVETGTSEGALKASYHHARKKIESVLRTEAESLFH
jgi:RNA polymerase sigma-70 factor (ECF subfamily)